MPLLQCSREVAGGVHHVRLQTHQPRSRGKLPYFCLFIGYSVQRKSHSEREGEEEGGREKVRSESRGGEKGRSDLKVSGEAGR